MKDRSCLIGLIALLWNAFPLKAAPISFNTALPVHEGGFLLRTQVLGMKAGDDPSSLGREMTVVAVPFVFVYGATPKLALMSILPYLDKKLEVRSLGITRSASGLGDLSTLARYQIYGRNWLGRTVRGAVFGGLKWPTGKDNERDSLGELPRLIQVGTGSYDPFLGTVWTGQWLSFQLDTDLSYRRNTEADDFKFGDEVAQNTSIQIRLWPKELKAQGVPNYLYGVLELSQSYQAKNESIGVKDPDSGGYQLFVTPGLQWVSKRTVFEVAVQLPAVQDLNGNALKTDYHLIGSFRIWF